jgi:S-adenosylmethionine synthetase
MFEKVNPSHPDKVADRIAGAIVDLCYTKSRNRWSNDGKLDLSTAEGRQRWAQANPKVACEVLIGHGECNIQVETSELISAEDIGAIVSRIAGEGIETRALIVPQDIHLAANQQHGVRCGDNGIFRGVPPTHEQKLLTAIAASIYDKHPFDGKYIIQGKGRLAAPEFDVTICQSHLSREQEPELREHLKNAYGIHLPIINPLGEWTGGPNTDSGATNRKLGSDMGDGVTGGGLHGKDLSKADVSVNIWCYLESIRTGHEVTASCSIGDETVNGIPYKDIVEQARLYIHTLGGFEKFAEWGLVRPLAQV